MNCPKCNFEMNAGYSCANTSLSWIEKEKFNSFMFTSEDLAKSGFRSVLPWKGWYFPAFNCQKCKVIFVDYSQKYDRKTIAAKYAV